MLNTRKYEKAGEVGRRKASKRKQRGDKDK
jgi:hypothetical protein